MSIFRVEKNSNYTVISNYHLRDKNLSLRTIGLLSLILSLPDDWDYTQAGLAAICSDGINSISSGLKELEKFGYLERERERDERGLMRGTIYRVYEIPKDKRDILLNTKTYGSNKVEDDTDSGNLPDQNTSNVNSPTLDKPKYENPILENPILDNPILDEPILDSPRKAEPKQDNQGQINIDLLNKDLLNKDYNNIYPSINPEDRKKDGSTDELHRKALEEIIKENVGYDFFERKAMALENQLGSGEIDLFDYDTATMTYDLKTVNQVIDYMIDILTSLNDDPIKVGDELISRNMVKMKLRKVDLVKMKKVVYELNSNQNIKNPKKYAISMLYNA